jgi:molybdate transport system ATP-binding protein
MTLELDLRLQRGTFELALCTTLSAPVTGVFGSSGSGKSTLLRMIAGLIQPQQGRIVLNDRVLLDTTRRINLVPQHRCIGLMFQDAQLFPHLSVEQNLLYGFKRRHASARRFACDDIVDLLDIGHLLPRLPYHLSGGEKQRVALGRAILYSPELLLLDEPLSSLDEARKAQILPFLARVRDEVKIPMLYVSHAMSEIRFLTDHVVALSESV